MFHLRNWNVSRENADRVFLLVLENKSIYSFFFSVRVLRDGVVVSMSYVYGPG